jgi:type VI secretion system protein VasD
LKSSAIIGARFLLRIASDQLKFFQQLRPVETVVARAQRGCLAMPLNVAVSPFPQGKPMSAARFFVCVLCCPLLVSCTGGAGSAPAGLLGTVGLRKPPPLPEAQLGPRSVALRLHAAKRLNVDARGQPLALLVRVYKLRQRTAFEQAPYAAFLSPQSEREALGADLLEVRELMLVPGQQLELSEKLAREAGWLGVVALFHSPPAQGWRLAFAAPEAEKSGVTIGLHACAMSSSGSASGAGAGPAAAKPLALVRCQ